MNDIISSCKELLSAYKKGLLGQTIMPEDTNPGFTEQEREQRYSYFTLPMALNYQRNSYKLWEAALKTYNDPTTRSVFEVGLAANDEKSLRLSLTKYKLALQPNKHISTWKTITNTIANNWGSFENLLTMSEHDFLKLRDIVQKEYKKGFPYLSGPKIFNYWSFILNEYCGANLTNSEYIEVAPDTHVIKCSVLLGVISESESEKLSREEISKRWRSVLEGSGITPIQMHPALWFWSRNGFIYKLNQ